MVYLDHAATTYLREEVLSAMMPYYTDYFGNPSSAYACGRKAHEALDKAREQVSKAINAATPREVYFTSGGSESDNWALKGIALANADKGKHIIITKAEHHAILHSAAALEKLGFSVTYLDVDKYGMVNLDDIKAAVRKDTILISVIYANNEVGTINPISEIGAFAREKGILFHTDAVQAIGHIDIDVQAENIDLLSLSGHKFYASKGVGALYIKRGVKINNLIDGGAQERNRRAGTENIPGIVGLAHALNLAKEEMPNEIKRLNSLRDYMIKAILENIQYAYLNGHPEKRLPGNVNISFAYVEAEASLLALDLAGIACSSGSACNSSSFEPSHVLLAMGLEPMLARGSIRFTMGKNTTKQDIDFTINELVKIIDRLRAISPISKGAI